jgi:hypothetical protein
MNTTLKSFLFFVIVIIAAVFVIGVIRFNVNDDALSSGGGEDRGINNGQEFKLTAENGAVGVLMYTSADKTKVRLTIGDMSYELKQVVSQSGTQFANEDELIVYLENQGQATIEINGEIAYTISTIEEADIKEFTIEPQKQECVGGNSIECLVVNGNLFYDTIDGFDFQEGTEYRIVVAETQKGDAGADAGDLQYTLVEVISFEATQNDMQSARTMHFSWDQNNDGLNDCEGDATCDGNVDYTQPRPVSAAVDLIM